MGIFDNPLVRALGAPVTGGASLLPGKGGLLDAPAGNNLFDQTIGRGLGAVGIEAADLPVIGGLFTNPEDVALQQSIERMRQAYQQYRPLAAQGRMNALGNQLSQFAPVQAQLSKMYGPSASFDLTKLLQNPMPEGMSAVGSGGIAGMR